MAGPRTTAERKRDALVTLQEDVDLWVASANERGDAYLVPLSFVWDGTHIVVATPAKSRTARNLRRAGVARVAIGPTRDVVIIEGDLDFIAANQIDGQLAAAFAAHTGFDPRREQPDYVYIFLTPLRIQSWREANELAGREIMRDGRWLA